MAQKERYLISYKEVKGSKKDVTAKTIKEANLLYDMIGNEAESKVLKDSITGKVLRQDQRPGKTS